MLFESYTEVEMRLRKWWIERGLVFSIGRNPWRNIPRPISIKTCNISIEYYASNTRMRNRWRRQRQSFWQFEHGGCHPVQQLNKLYIDWSFGWPSGISVTANGVDLWSW
jgi:hypothetical protein